MAAELVGGAVLSAALQVMFEKIASPEVVDYLRGKKLFDFDGLLKKLKIMLSSLTAVLDDAEQKQIRNRGIKEWLDELQEAVYDAEDILGEIEYDALRLKVDAESGTSTSKVTNFFSAIFDSTDQERKTKMEEILDRLEYIAKQKDVLGLKEGVGKTPPRRLPSTSLIEESEVYGRDDDKDALVKLLLDDLGGKEICVIPIVGMGGVGKTTLAQALFNNDEVKRYFEVKAWVCVSEEFDVRRVTKTILEEVTAHACDVTDLNFLQVKLKERLTRKKFLIVLDDVWNENYIDWDFVKMPFKDGAQGTKIIVTTRSEKVASIMGTVPFHYLKELSDKACWQLFVKHAFGNGDLTEHLELARVGREIVKKCKGLPLAIKTLGGLLRSTMDVVEWERISKSDVWDLKDEESHILPALRLSYHYLPSNLKRCFAYCSMFPKDYRFKKDELVFLWMADNLLEHPRGNKRIEEVGDEHFNDLVSRSFFQCLNANGKPSFIMHDLLVDLAKLVSGKYYILLERGNLDENVLTKQARHLAYVMPWLKTFNSISNATHLRTFLPLKFGITGTSFESSSIPVQDLLKLRCLRFLSFSGYKNTKHLPPSIGKLKHIRYLDLSYTSINVLPDSVSMLYNLQILKLVLCRYLTNLPKNFHHHIKLRYLDVKGSGLVEMPTQISKLKNLQRLSTFVVGKDSGARIGELGELSDLKGELCIKNLQNLEKAEHALEAKLRDKRHLEKLEFEWGDDTCDSKYESDVLENLCPNTKLKWLNIHKYGGTKFPIWLGDQSFCNLVDLSLRNCKYCYILPSLGQLLSLKTLWIEGFDAIVTVGPEFYKDSSSKEKPFASLESLRFYKMSSWEEWSMPDEDSEGSAFPKLKSLFVIDCEKLTGNLPCFLRSLTHLTVDRCPQLASSLPKMPVINVLRVLKCKWLTGLHVVESYGCLQCLDISDYHGSVTFSSLPVTLKWLYISDCENLEIPLHQSYRSLEELSIEYSCGSIRSIPLDSFPRIRDLRITRCKNLESLSVSDEPCEGLTLLSSLYISKCPKFLFPSGGLPCPNLTQLHIDDCNKLIASERSWNLQTLHNLKRFEICNCYWEDMESFPEEGLLPSTITHLEISGLPCLKTLNNNGLQELTSLEALLISDCPNLQTMSEKGPPTSLVYLRVRGCPLLQEKCQKEKGEYWNKIAHIPHIYVQK